MKRRWDSRLGVMIGMWCSRGLSKIRSCSSSLFRVKSLRKLLEPNDEKGATRLTSTVRVNLVLAQPNPVHAAKLLLAEGQNTQTSLENRSTSATSTTPNPIRQTWSFPTPTLLAPSPQPSCDQRPLTPDLGLRSPVFERRWSFGGSIQRRTSITYAERVFLSSQGPGKPQRSIQDLISRSTHQARRQSLTSLRFQLLCPSEIWSHLSWINEGFTNRGSRDEHHRSEI